MVETLNTMLEQILDLQAKALDGFSNPLEAYIELKRIADMATSAMKELKDQAIEEADKYGKGEHEEYGVKFQVKAAGGRYAYKHLQWYIESKEREKLAQEAFKQAQKGLTVVDADGEIVEPAEYTAGSQTLSISFK